MQQDWGIIFAFGLYFLALFGIGIFHMKKEQDLAGYVLGGRKVGPYSVKERLTLAPAVKKSV